MSPGVVLGRPPGDADAVLHPYGGRLRGGSQTAQTGTAPSASAHPNAQRIRDAYDAFSQGDLGPLDDLLAEDVEWHEAGRNQLSGVHRGRDGVRRVVPRLGELTEGTLRIDVRTVLADDTHGVVVLRASARRGDRSFDDVLEMHVHRFADGRVTEWHQAFEDQYAVDAVLG
ncbi:MAG TPA: nuclear transport factor 2 family protein [Geodermatophilus sp.]|nr:nuclear transport factor 2 family protein [Geodermatophilus sp.]